MQHAIDPGNAAPPAEPRQRPPLAVPAKPSRERPAKKPSRILIVGYGNELRTDDGAGPAVVRAVLDWRLPGVDGLICQQLTPDLAETVTHYRQVIFVDAIPARSCSRPQITRLQPVHNADLRTHSSDPGAILALAQRLYNRCPEAWILAVPAFSFAFGEGLSVRTRGIFAAALESLRGLLSAR